MTTALLISVATFLVALAVLHVVVWHAIPSKSPRPFLLVFLAAVSMAISGVLDVLLAGFNGFELCALVWIDSFFAILYVILYAIIARSVSFTLLSHLLRDSDEPVELNDIVEEYALSSRFSDRVALMETGGFVRTEGSRVTLTRKGIAVAGWAKTLGGVFGDGLQG